ncbi:MAG: acetyl-CoA carboxylase biotin carboxylase subunit, partial [Candidatus Sericytochromatia bacterium]
EITGIDLVEVQIKVASGENISYLRELKKTIGHSIQCRIYSEDSFNFLPSTGKISYLALPEGDSLRIESGVVQGETISELYDPMLMKIITTGINREKAIKNMLSALKNLYITGELNTNQMLLIEAIESKEFKDATYNTQTLYGIKPNLDNKIDIEITEELFKLLGKKETKILVNKNNNSDYWRPSFWDKR